MVKLLSAQFRNHTCFKESYAGFEAFPLVTVLIGRNNSGKTHLLALVEILCGPDSGQECDIRYTAELDPTFLQPLFPHGTAGGILTGNHWFQHGEKLVGSHFEWTVRRGAIIEHGTLPTPDATLSPSVSKVFADEYTRRVVDALGRSTHQFTGKVLRRLNADRDISPEPASQHLDLLPNGQGATNIIRRVLLSSSQALPAAWIKDDVLGALNEIFGSDATFTSIEAKVHDQAAASPSSELWEVYLGEKGKGLVPLSQSGSGLRTALLVLLNLLVLPKIRGSPPQAHVYAFEELENNLHPALLRRLLTYVEGFARKYGARVFLTTHSSTALDMFGLNPDAQLIHVTHDGKEAHSSTVSAHFDHLGVVSELGAKPSDLLQANGVIWVEGPSDYIYINKWIDIFGGGRLREGRDYQCAFYGGSLLARTQFTTPEAAEAELVNLFRLNTNIIVVCDSDRTSDTGQGSRIKDRVRRINAEVSGIPGAHVWVTGAREIENYLPGEVLAKTCSVDSARDPDRYEQFFASQAASAAGGSYMESVLGRKSLDKMDLAIQAVRHMNASLLADRFDLAEQMNQIIAVIGRWNS